MNHDKEEKPSSSISLSDLPDEILHYILSFFEAQDVDQKSTLLKWWECLFISTPNLHIDDSSIPDYMLAQNFVERAIFCRDFIKSFHIESCRGYHYASRIDSLIYALIMRNVQELNLVLHSFSGPFVLPNRLFSCKSLVDFKVELSHNFFKLPPSLCFSSLKTLSLKSVTFSDEHSINQLFSSCQELILKECRYLNLKVINVCCVPKLLRLTVHEESDYGEGDSYGCQINVRGSNLKYYHYIGTFANGYYPSSLDKACIVTISHPYLNRNKLLRKSRLLQCLTSVKVLKLLGETLEFATSKNVLYDDLPMFKNLTHLEMDDPRHNYLVLKILKNTPRLETLIFHSGIHFFYVNGDLIPVPPCSCLKIIKVYKFDEATLPLIDVVKCLLKCAVALEKIIVSLSPGFENNSRQKRAREQRVREKLLQLPKGSTGCEVVVTTPDA